MIKHVLIIYQTSLEIKAIHKLISEKNYNEINEHILSKAIPNKNLVPSLLYNKFPARFGNLPKTQNIILSVDNHIRIV